MIRERPNSTLEVVVYFGRTHKPPRRSVTIRGTGRDAWKRARRVEADLLRDAAKAREPVEHHTVDELIEKWRKVVRHEKSTATRTVESSVVNQIRPHLGRIRVADLTLQRIDEWVVDIEREGGVRPKGGPLAPGTVRRVFNILHAALEQAVRWEWIERNPATGATLSSVPKPRPQPPTKDQVRALLARARADDPELLVFARLAAVTGTRRGGLCALRWSDVDLDNGQIRKVAAIKEAATGTYVGATKTGAESYAAIGDSTSAMLREHRARQEARAAEFGKSVAPDGYLFARDFEGRQYWTPGGITKRFARLRAAAGLPSSVKLKQLRHFSATELLDNGFALPVVASRLDHVRTATTTDFYAGARAASDQAAADFLNELLDAQSAGG